MSRNYFHLHLVSDATGETLIAASRAASALYPGVSAIEHVYPLVRTRDQLSRVIGEIEREPGIVLYTLVDPQLSGQLEEECRAIGCPSLSVLKPVSDLFGAYLGTEKGHRPADFRYLKEIAQAVDRLGFGGVLLPTGRGCDDPFITAAALAPLTERLRFLVALRPGVASPTFAARQAAALDRISNGRFLVNVVTGGNPGELAGDALPVA